MLNPCKFSGYLLWKCKKAETGDNLHVSASIYCIILPEVSITQPLLPQSLLRRLPLPSPSSRP